MASVMSGHLGRLFFSGDKDELFDSRGILQLGLGMYVGVLLACFHGPDPNFRKRGFADSVVGMGAGVVRYHYQD